MFVGADETQEKKTLEGKTFAGLKVIYKIQKNLNFVTKPLENIKNQKIYKWQCIY